MKILFCFFCVGFCSVSAFGAFDPRPAGARAAVLSGLSGAPDALSVYENPASAAALDRAELSSFHARLYGLPELSQEGMAAAFPVRSGAWAFAYDRFGVPDYREQEVLLARSILFSESVSFGAALKGLHLRIADFGSALAWAADAGFELRLKERWTASLSARNLNRPRLGPVSPPSGFLAGLSYRLAEFLRIEARLDQSSGGPLSFRSGLEGDAGRIRLRGGWNSQTASFSGGFGLEVRSVRVDYAYVQTSALAPSHVLSVGLRFGPRVARTPREPLSFSRTDLQTARVEDLMEVPGVGRVTAEKIVRFREEYGLREFDDLLEIPGLRRAQFLGLKGRFTLSPAPKP